MQFDILYYTEKLFCMFDIFCVFSVSNNLNKMTMLTIAINFIKGYTFCKMMLHQSRSENQGIFAIA